MQPFTQAMLPNGRKLHSFECTRPLFVLVTLYVNLACMHLCKALAHGFVEDGRPTTFPCLKERFDATKDVAQVSGWSRVACRRRA